MNCRSLVSVRATEAGQGGVAGSAVVDARVATTVCSSADAATLKTSWIIPLVLQ